MCQQQGCPIELSPARFQLIHELRARGYEIYVFFPGSVLNKKIKNEIHHFTNTSCLSTKDIRNRIVKINPEYVVGFTYEDTNILYTLTRTMKRTCFIYYNLEIYTPYMEKYIQKQGILLDLRCLVSYIQNKYKEVLFVKRCKVFVIQDRLRKRTSAKYFISHPNTLLIPNSYNIDMDGMITERHGMIYSGGLSKNTLESLISGLDPNIHVPLTFSGWSDEWFKVQYKIIREKHPEIKIISQKLSPEDFSNYLKKYAVGLIWYSPTKDENVNNIGLSSGKLFKHLSIGQPVIVNESPGLSRVVNKLKLGVVIKDVSELEMAYKQIMENYQYYQRQIKKVYVKFFDYKKVVRNFFEEMEKFE